MDAAGSNKVNIWYGKISNTYILTLPQPQGHGMSVRYEINLQSKFGDCITIQTLNVALKQDGIMDRQTNRQTIRLLDAPSRPYRPEHKYYGSDGKVSHKEKMCRV